MPITRSGRVVTAASEPIGIEEVFEARIASPGSVSSARRKTSSLTAASSIDRLDHQVGGDELVDGLDPGQHLVRVGPALLCEPRQAPVHRLEPALDRAGRGVVERHPAAGRGHHLRDPAAHLAGADHEDVAEPHGFPSRASASVIAYIT